jgi:hypothetical protein
MARVGSLSDRCHKIEVDYQSGSKQSHSKGSADLCASFKLSEEMNPQALASLNARENAPSKNWAPGFSRHPVLRQNSFTFGDLRLTY